MYNERNDQIFITLESDEDPTEFLLDKQPLEMIRANITTKEEIRETVELGRQDVVDTYSRAFPMQNYEIMTTVYIRLDKFLRIVDQVEKLYY